jgi:hypothetical protein
MAGDAVHGDQKFGLLANGGSQQQPGRKYLMQRKPVGQRLRRQERTLFNLLSSAWSRHAQAFTRPNRTLSPQPVLIPPWEQPRTNLVSA